MKRTSLIFCLLLIICTPGYSQVWHRASGMSDYIFSLAVKDSSVFALINKDGLFSSSDNGKTWTNLGFAFDMSLGTGWGAKPKIQVNNNKIYIGIYLYGLFVSSDNGYNWSKINIPYNNLLNFIIDDNNIFISMGNREYISNDNGISWQEVSTGCEECIYCLAMKDSNIYAGNDWGGLYISTNGGKTWEMRWIGQNELPLSSIVLIEDTLYIGTAGGGIYKSTDKGQNWTDINNGLTYFKVNSIVFDGINIFAGTNGKAIFLSADGGQHWRRINNDYAEEYSNINSIAAINKNIFAGCGNELLFSSNFDKQWETINNGVSGQVNFLLSDKSNVLASTGEGLYLSSNHGLSWSHISKDFFRKDYFRIFAINSLWNKLFVGTHYNGILSSNDNGLNWENHSNGIPEFAWVNTFAVKDGIIYAGLEHDGIFMSSDSGSNWYYVNNIFPYSITVYSIAIEDSLILVGSAEGMYLSTNNGVTWSQSGKEIYDNQVYSCLIKNNTFYAGIKDVGMLISTDKGQSWSQKNIGDSPVSSFTACGNTIYAGTIGAGVFYSTNNGKIWIQKIKGLRSYNIESFLTIGDTVIAMIDTIGLFFTTNKSDNWTFMKRIGGNAIYIFNNEIYIGHENGMSISSDFGETWIDLDSGLYTKEYLCFWDNVAIEDSNVIIVDNYHNFFHSTNLGENWTLVSNGIKEYINTLELHNNTLYLSTVKGFYKTSDFGHTWIKSDYGLVDTNIGSFSYDNGKILIWSDGKFFLSFDDAESWNQLSDFPPNYSITDYELSDNYIIISTVWEGIILSSDLGKTWIFGSVNPLYTSYITDIDAKDNIVFAGCMFDSMYYSTYYGHNWRVANSGIWDYNYNDVCVYTLAISEDNYVYTSPHSNGVYRLNIDEITEVNEKPIEENDSFFLFPNPSSDFVFVKCNDLTINQNIKIYDILGNIVWQGIMNGESKRIDVSIFPTGVYYLNINGCTRMFVKN